MTELERYKPKQNTWGAKINRTRTCILPIDPSRRGQCNRCGDCCRLPVRCPFLDFDEEGLAICKIYPVRPLNCRKYPRTESEQVNREKCGFSFDKTADTVVSDL